MIWLLIATTATPLLGLGYVALAVRRDFRDRRAGLIVDDLTPIGIIHPFK